MIDISVIIPCFNHGKYIQEAIDSVLACKNVNYEIIIINDGSDDPYTVNKIKSLKTDKHLIIDQPNSGLAYSRNIGISKARGKFILPLDADNKITPEYIHSALKIFKNSDVDIVHANPIFFGDNDIKRRYISAPFKIESFFLTNSIDACAIFKKELWEKIGGYDENMPNQGHEDWEFWIHAYKLGAKFHYINEELFYYRIVSNSMITKNTNIKTEKNQSYIIDKHFPLFLNTYKKIFQESLFYKKDSENPLRSTIKYLFKSLKALTQIKFKSYLL
ncbi:putative glycosyltransferase EpsJ [Pedobacter glucosidilyticus]|nr:glycosyltransferase [Pedobacter glucosidilyticus]KHJ36985.1 putative glycosyltransferase EpsJ [Pedobacter glucosidilyticus]